MESVTTQFRQEPAKGGLVVVATCSSRKRKTGTQGPRFRDLGDDHGSGTEAAESWIRRLGESGTSALPAADLYVGNQWAILRELVRQTGVGVWVASAGYGLVSAAAPLSSYSATFSAGHPDSVQDPGTWGWGANASQNWWRAVSAWVGPSPGQPRSLVELVRLSRPSGLMALLSPPYLKVLKEDLLAAREVLGADRLVLLTAGSRQLEGFGSSLVRIEGRLTSKLGGSMGTLAARVAAHVVANCGPAAVSAPAAATVVDRLLADAKPLRRFDRRVRPDDQIKNWISRELKSRPAAAGALLRRYRDAGYACEQARFRRLVELVRETGRT